MPGRRRYWDRIGDVMSEYFDIRCGDDIDRFARDVPPLETFAQDVYHWLITDRGSLMRDPNWGFGLTSYLGTTLPNSLASDIESGIRRDTRASDAKCTITKGSDEEWSYRLELQVEVDDQFLTLALALTPSGIVRVAE